MEISSGPNSETVEEPSSGTFPEKYDLVLSQMFEAENKSVTRFFDAVFGYFSRNYPDLIYDSSKYGKQVMTSTYDKWQSKYNKERKISPAAPSLKRSRGDSSLDSDKSGSEEKNGCWTDAPNPGGPTHTTNTTTTSRRRNNDNNLVVTGSKKEKIDDDDKTSSFDTTNGSKFGNYAWTQSIDDVEVRVPVKAIVRKANQVKVAIEKKRLKVDVEIDGSFVSMLDDEILQPVRVEDSVWLLAPSQYVSILLEKLTDEWWDRLLISEPRIDLKKIITERPLSTLSEEDRKQIEKVMEDKRRECRGEPSIDQAKMEALLKKSWDAEGSPFKGQPFDPSLINCVTSSTSK